MSLLDFQQQPEAAPETFEGTVADDATGPGEPVRVVIPEFDRQLAHGPCPWTPIVTSTGIFWPKIGDGCTVVEPSAGQPVIVSWTPRATSPDQPLSVAHAAPLYVTSLPGSPYDGQEVYLVDGAVDRHLRYNGSAWRPVVGPHASTHASGGSDPLAVASLAPEIVNMDGRFGEVGIGGNVVVSSTSSGAKITNDFWIDVQAGEVALLVFKGTLLAATSNDWQFGVFDGKTSGGSEIMSYAYVSGTGGWVQFMTLGVAAPSSTTYYRGTAQRVYGSGTAELSGVSTRIYKIILGGKP